MNFLTIGTRINREIEKRVKKLEIGGDLLEGARDMIEAQVWGEYAKDIETGMKAWELFQQAMPDRSATPRGANQEHWFFITLRPGDDVAFGPFRALMEKLVNKPCFLQYTLSFEQKGTDDDSLGRGKHAHIVASMKQRSKGEALRDIQRATSALVGANFVDVKICKNPAEHVQRYLVDYVSADDHKIVTKEADGKWRAQLGLRALYTCRDDWGVTAHAITFE